LKFTDVQVVGTGSEASFKVDDHREVALLELAVHSATGALGDAVETELVEGRVGSQSDRLRRTKREGGVIAVTNLRFHLGLCPCFLKSEEGKG
jgi:hypothetical protein